ncbi:hypothetical protein ACVD2R_20975, partial [Escherichia coli]
MTDNVIVGHAGCGVNALSGLQILKHSISCNACCRYCYGLQVFSWSGFPACQTQRRQALFFSSLPRFLRRYRIMP